MKASSDTTSSTRRHSRCRLFMIVALMVSLAGYGNALQAQQAVTYMHGLDGAAEQLAKDSSRTVIDSVLFNAGAFPPLDPQAPYTISNIIVFYINESSPRMLPDSFKAELTLRVYFTKTNNVSDSVAEKKLNIDYYKSRSYNNKAVYYFAGAKSVTVKVQDIQISYASSSVVLPLLKVENRMVVTRTFGMDCGDDAITTVSHNTATVATKGELQVSWPGRNAAREYDLEWTFIDQSALDAGWYTTGGSLDPGKLFRNNATRVTIPGNTYYIPLLYEGDGRLFYRVRGVQTTPDKERKVTAWSSAYAAQGGLGEYVFEGHERSLNWQSATSFAEAGKRKSVVQYFDGTLRSRQTVTKDNTTDTTLVAETFYDKQGRAVIQVLPAPSLSALIGYHPLFNRARVNGAAVENTPGVYDTLETAAGYCEAAAPPLDSVSGAAQYYSYNNPNKLNPIHKFLPRAKGYPFSEVKYTQDNTGRIASQGGVGPQFQLGSGHETRYYYGTPLQSELDALFGTEAGIASHYQKNMVRDANGQYSVSYVDMHGRTVATALAGATPGSMQALPSYRDSTQTDALLTPVNNVIKGNAITSVSTLLVARAGVDSFFYTLNAESLQLPDKDAVEICYDCLYDLEITIADDCNNQHLPDNELFVYRKSNMRVQPPVYDTTCAPAGNFEVKLGLHLEEGSYVVTKKLTLRADAQAYYRDSLYAPHHTVHTKEDIIAGQLSRIREQRENDCVQEGEPWYMYQQYREQMLLDMTPPFGQYAAYPGSERLPSIFNMQETRPQYSTVSYPYSGGAPDPATLSPEQFLYNFEPGWATALLPLHPEYCMLQGYEQYKPSYHWDADFEAADTYQQAMINGYLNPTNLVSSPASGFGNGNDSLFYGGANSASKTWLSDSLTNYKALDGKTYSLWATASIMAHCDPTDGACVNSFYNTPGNAFNPGVMGCEGEMDMAWRFFRNEYLRLKHKRIDDIVRSVCQPVIAVGASPVFPDEAAAIAGAGDLLNSDLAAAQQAAADNLANRAESTCLAYVESWWRQLETCQYSAEDSAIIIPRLIEVCKQGSDSTHPFGAGSVRPGSNYEYRSFDEVITQYNAGIGKPGNAACNAYLIDAPAPYNRPVLVTEQPLYAKPDACACEKITTLHDQYGGASGYSSFSDYVQKTLHTSISQGALDSLLDLCNGNIECRYIAKPVTLPPALQCATGYDVCADCNTVDQTYTAFITAFPGTIPAYAEMTEQQQANNRLFANYMNNKLGFSKSAVEYLQFMDSCGVGTTSSYDSLITIKKLFRDEMYDIHYDSDGIDTTTWKVDFGSSYNNTGTPHEDIFINGIAHYPYPIQGSNHVDFDYMFPQVKDSVCLNNNFRIEFRLKNPVPDSVLSHGTELFWLYGDNGSHHFIFRPVNSYWNAFCTFHSPNTPDTCRYSLNNFVKRFDDWRTVKIIAQNNKFDVYLDAAFIESLDYSYAGPLNRLYGFSIVLNTKNNLAGSIDWIRLYDSTGNLLYNEDFDNLPNFSHISEKQPCNVSGCQTAFTAYYNQQKGASYTFSQIDSVYTAAGLVLDVCILDTASVRCDQLEQYVQQYKDQLGKPASGYVDLDMRTFAGNKTPDEGPKGVFDVKGKLLGNTVDSTPTAVKQSFVQIWNSSADNREVGTLSLLGTGRFRLFLNPGKQAPKEGIVGQRYYQLDSYAQNAPTFMVAPGSFIDYGEGQILKIDSTGGNAATVIETIKGVEGAYFGMNQYYVPDLKPYSYFIVSHNYPDADHRTISIYHTDYKGVVFLANGSLRPKNLRGFMPQETLFLKLGDLKDSAYFNFSNIRNFDQITSIEHLSIVTDSFSTGKHDLFPITRNKNLKIIHFLDGNKNNADETPLSRITPALNENFEMLRWMQVSGTTTANFDSINFTLPHLRYLALAYLPLTPAQVDRVLNQIASVNEERNGLILTWDISATRTSASDAAFNKLLSQDWQLILTNNWSSFVRITTPEIIDNETYPFATPFTDFINSKFNTNLTAAQVDSLYLARCGHKPNWYDTAAGSFPTGLLLCGRNEPVSPALRYEEVYDPPCSDSATLAFNSGTEIYARYKDSLSHVFDSLYTAKCLGAAALEQFSVKRPVSEYHYTLYYYDQAGNLVKTIPPEGVNPIRRQGWLDTVALKRAAGERWVNGHTMPTVYRYNSLNQVVSSQTPDAGKSSNWYDRLGRLAVSRNAQQKTDGKYSYTIYDTLGRITEVGQKPQSTPMTDAISRSPDDLAAWLFYNNNGANGAEMVTQTVYDHPGIDATACVESLRFTQKPHTLRNRVSYTRYYEKPLYYNGGDGRYYISGQSYTTGVDYSYDIHGNVDTMRNLYGSMQYGPMAHHGYNGCKTIAYTYDLISGKVNEVHYNPGQSDEFYHRYEYDAENRLTDVYTTDNKLFLGQQGLEEHDAFYTYYRHGPLARMVLGQLQIQGQDYTYTLQGWLKGMNASSVNSGEHDPGRDGRSGYHFSVCQDLYGLTLNYFKGDYAAIDYSVDPYPDHTPYMPAGMYKGLYNGNISSMMFSMPTRYNSHLYNYQYDQLNRLVAMDVCLGFNTPGNHWQGLSVPDTYKERYRYDGNGNIMGVLRNSNLTANPLMDSLTYFYTPGANRLDHIRDRYFGSATHSNNYSASIDIKDQAAGNYSYDDNGNLRRSVSGGLDTIKWNIYGKITQVSKQSLSGATARFIYHYYDPSGYRAGKTVRYGTGGSAYYNHTWYVRDASGNVLATYVVNNAANAAAGVLKLTEHHMYACLPDRQGSGHLGIVSRDQDMDEEKIMAVEETNLGNTYLLNFTRGEKFFEVTNHLGTVVATLSDRRTVTAKSGDPTTIGKYTPVRMTAADYYPFGMAMPGRHDNGSLHRYGFNGKEMDNEALGVYNWLDYGMRAYDPRTGRFWSVDPKAAEMPSWSPYSFSFNNPILFIDPDGAFPYTFHIRAFAPPGAFKGSGFHDDNRGFSTSMGVTSRIKQNFTVDPTARTFTGGQPTSDPTIWNGFSRTATDEGGASASFGKNFLGSATADISANFEGSNPFFLGAAPDIEVSTGISITENLKTNQLFVALDLSSKQFPATEGLIQDNAGNTIFLAGAAAFGGASNLARADKKKVASVDLIIGINDKGVFQNVTMGGKQYTLEEFNKLGTEKSAGPFPRKDKDK